MAKEYLAAAQAWADARYSHGEQSTRRPKARCIAIEDELIAFADSNEAAMVDLVNNAREGKVDAGTLKEIIKMASQAASALWKAHKVLKEANISRPKMKRIRKGLKTIIRELKAALARKKDGAENDTKVKGETQLATQEDVNEKEDEQEVEQVAAA